jgi:hypothetical protein
LTGILGELNGQTNFGGTATTDPHHSQAGNREIQTYIKSHDVTKDETIVKIHNFANSYSGQWAWRPGDFGQNCHSFQNSLVYSASLIREDEIDN